MIGSKYLSFSFIIQELPFLHNSCCNHIAMLHSRFCYVCHQYCAQFVHHVFLLASISTFFCRFVTVEVQKVGTGKGFRCSLRGDKNNRQGLIKECDVYTSVLRVYQLSNTSTLHNFALAGWDKSELDIANRCNKHCINFKVCTSTCHGN